VQIEFSPVDEGSLARANRMAAELYRRDGLAVTAVRDRALAELITHPECGGAWLILAGGEAAGYLVLTACYSLEFHGRFGLLDELFIEEAWRGRGIGSAALTFVDEQCRARGWKTVRLEVDDENAGARRLYERAGYRTEHRRLMTKYDRPPAGKPTV